MERSERTGREQRVAGSPQDPRVRQLTCEFLQQRRLAYAGLATDKRDAATVLSASG